LIYWPIEFVRIEGFTGWSFDRITITIEQRSKPVKPQQRHTEVIRVI
jgi:hypothetical protein